MKKETGRILVVEDDHEDQILLKRAFEESGLACELHMMDDGEEALTMLKGTRAPLGGEHPDLIILDLNMPSMSGKEVLEIILQDPDLKRIPVIVFTTSGARDDIESCYDLGAKSYIQKPSTFAELKHAVPAIIRYWFHTVRIP